MENGVSAVISRVKDKEVNLIEEQIRLAMGEPLGYTQKDISSHAVGIEYRIIAEDPEDKFTPWVGRIEKFSWAPAPWVKVHTQVPTNRPYDIPTEFDPNLALAIIWGNDLDQAKERGKRFLNDLILEGKNKSGQPLKSNIKFLLSRTDDLLKF